jgi:hypothetical protein
MVYPVDAASDTTDAGPEQLATPWAIAANVAVVNQNSAFNRLNWQGKPPLTSVLHSCFVVQTAYVPT